MTLEVLLDNLQSAHIPHAYRRDLEWRITHRFSAPPPALELLREFPHVVIMDSTYKTNRLVEDLLICTPPTLNADTLKPSLQMCLKNVIHSVPDSNCGYRSIAYFTKGDHKAYHLVRQELLEHVLVNKDSLLSKTCLTSIELIAATKRLYHNRKPALLAH
ncbi:hypothetical protein PsorP6_002302 [Peronosclerospora sorghi]|uniref:Uncharacterized protein n=1 Tax=Peronosclerospora sorghi TaxID=230839 RepID=A0ACC0WRX1_9STRA|nr:hypothetical protein PsorP6_002302 [Peronosclerospora sorghi]